MAKKGKIRLRGGVDVPNVQLEVGAFIYNKLSSNFKYEYHAYKDAATKSSDPSNTLPTNLMSTISMDSALYQTKLKPLVNQITQEIYKWSEMNSFEELESGGFEVTP
jgi:hypothetical protein